MKRIRLDRPLPKKQVPESAPEGPEGDPDFAALMKRDGVTPLEAETSLATSKKGKQQPALPDPPVEEAPRLRSPQPAEPEQDEAALNELKTENERLAEELDALRQDRGRIDAERRALARRVAELQEEDREPSPSSLSALLERRGCRTHEEREACLRYLIESDALDRLLELAVTPESQELAAILDSAVSFVCGRDECRPAAGSQPLVVDAHRCEVCGGSDLRLAAKKLFDACLKKGLKRIRVVGGSPTYHTQLRELASESDVELKLISGVERRTEREAKADQKHSDLVVLWGATLLDHSTSELYERSRSWVVTVPHRGLAGMLGRLAERLGRGRDEP